MTSRWAEDWRAMEGERTPTLKAIHVAGDAALSLSSEVRVRSINVRNDRLVRGTDITQTQVRAVLGAKLHLNSRVSFYGELGTGQVDTGRDDAAPNFQNRVSAQQIFVDLRSSQRSHLVGAMVGRQEFSDGPRQLISLSDGPNLHRTWNGVRVYAHARRYRMGAFELRATQLGNGGFDEGVQNDTILRGITGSFIVSSGEGPNVYLDPFWFHTEMPNFKLGGESGPDKRDTLGFRHWGRRGAVRWDWTAARQRGTSLGGRRIDAWAFFAVQSVMLSEHGWQPKLTSHVDIASGGGLNTGPNLRTFHPLYASSNYLGESQFLGLSNVMLVAPGISLTPSKSMSLSLEYGRARRLDSDDAAYAGGMRAYPGTAGTRGHHIGDLTRVSGAWSPTPRLAFTINVEHLAAGHVLRSAGLRSGTYAQFGATYRY